MTTEHNAAYHASKGQDAKGPDAIQFFDTPHGSRIAWKGNDSGDGKDITIVFFAGHGSDMEGTKALATADWAAENGFGMIRFDYSGHGQSSGDIMDGTIGLWRDDALAVIDHLTTGPLVLVGSSLGGWLMVLAARARPDRIAGLIGIAAAPDFTDDLIWDALTPDQQTAMARDGQIALPNPYSPEDVVYPYALITEGRDHFVLRDRMKTPYPVRLLHGMDDEEVPWQTAEQLAACCDGHDINTILVEGAGHRFSEPDQIDLLLANLGEVTLAASKR